MTSPKTRWLLICLAALPILLSACNSGSGTRLFTIGILNVNTATQQTLDSFKDGMKALGYIEGQTVRFIYNGPTNSTDAKIVATRLTELLDAKVDLIFVMNTAIAVGAAKLETTTPIVFAAVYDPVASGIVPERIHPGKNVTGVLHGISEPKRMEWFTRIAPTAKRYYVPYNPRDASATLSLAAIKDAAAQLGITILERPCTADPAKSCTTDDVLNVVTNVPGDADAIMCPADALIVGQLKKINEVAFARKLPVSVIGHPDVESGALFSYGFNFKRVGGQAARLTDQILRGGVKAGDLPIEAAELDLFINLDTAAKIGLFIPSDILIAASTILRPAPSTASATARPTVTGLPEVATAQAILQATEAATLQATAAATMQATAVLTAAPTFASAATEVTAPPTEQPTLSATAAP